MSRNRAMALAGVVTVTGLAVTLTANWAGADDTPGRDASAGAVAPATIAGSAAAKKTKLFVRYQTKAACTVFRNYPKAGVKGNGTTFTVPAGKQLIWRYNVNSRWAMISDPARAKKAFPWWGFTDRGCIGNSVAQKDYPAGVAVPSKILQGRSNESQSGWRRVDFSLGRSSVVARHKKVKKNATLRDPANFVIGIVPAEWHVDVTRVKRSGGHWTKVYVPNAKRWGYIESLKLR